MIVLLTILHVLVCIALISIVLLQHGKGADIGAAFGGSSQTLFGSSGATTFLGKLTAGAAILFMLTTLGLTLVTRSDKGQSSVVDKVAPAAPIAPAAPASPAIPAPMPGSPK